MMPTPDLSYLAAIHGSQLDEMLVRRDYICPECGLANDYHVASCGILALLVTRRKMVPVVRTNNGKEFK